MKIFQDVFIIIISEIVKELDYNHPIKQARTKASAGTQKQMRYMKQIENHCEISAAY